MQKSGAKLEGDDLYYFLNDLGNPNFFKFMDVGSGSKVTFDANRVKAWNGLIEDANKRVNLNWLTKVSESPGESLIKKTNPNGVSFSNSIVGHNSSTSASALWNSSNKNFFHYDEGDFILKYDYDAGNLIFGKKSTGEIIGFYEGIENVSKVIDDLSPTQIVGKLKLYHGVSGAPSVLNANVSSGAIIISNPNKTASIIENYRRHIDDPNVISPNTGDMKVIIDENIGDLKSQQFGPKNNGFNVLNVSEDVVSNSGGWSNFWDNFNQPWLQNAITRGDDIWAASNPLELQLLFNKNLDEIFPAGVPNINTSEQLKMFIENYSTTSNLTGFGREVQFLSVNNYTYSTTSKMFVN